MALSYIAGQARVTWRDVLSYVGENGPVSAEEVALGLKLSGGKATKVEDFKKKSVSQARTRLHRLQEWGMIRRYTNDDQKIMYDISGYGETVLKNPQAKGEAEEKETEELIEISGLGHYPDIGAASKLVDDPVALMRLVEVDYDKFVREGLEALPTRIVLNEDQIAVEKKYDGWLSQSAGADLYSRRGKPLKGKFPPIDHALAEFVGEHLIGELVYWDRRTGKMNESNVTRVAGTAKPEDAIRKMIDLEKRGFFQVVVFDIIASERKDISKYPFSRRRQILENLIDSVDSRRDRITISQNWGLGDWKRVFKKSLDEGGEGVVLKNENAPYQWRPLGEREATPSGTQWKIKAVRSDDFVVFDSYVSEKEKLIVSFGQFWKGELVPVGEVNNFSKENEAEILRRLKRGPFIMEIAFQERFGKPPCRLRNPRMLRFRDDKPIESVTLPADCAP